MRAVLIIDDEPTSREVIGVCCEEAGYRTEFAEDGHDGLEKAIVDHFDLVITDYKMPRMDGKEFCRQLRLFERYHHTPIIVVSALAREIDAREIYEEYGAVLFPKPLDFASLFRKMQSLTATLPDDSVQQPASLHQAQPE